MSITMPSREDLAKTWSRLPEHIDALDIQIIVTTRHGGVSQFNLTAVEPYQLGQSQVLLNIQNMLWQLSGDYKDVAKVGMDSAPVGLPPGAGE